MKGDIVSSALISTCHLFTLFHVEISFLQKIVYYLLFVPPLMVARKLGLRDAANS